MASVRFISVKCVNPSCGTNDVALSVATIPGALLGGYIGAVAGVALAVPTGGVSLVLLAFSMTVGVTVGAGVSRGVAHTAEALFSGRDDLYIKVDEQKIWPPNYEYDYVDSQQVVELQKSYDLTRPVRIELWEHDTISSDDNLGGLEVQPNQAKGWYSYALISEEHNSHYEIDLQVY